MLVLTPTEKCSLHSSSGTLSATDRLLQGTTTTRDAELWGPGPVDASATPPHLRLTVKRGRKTIRARGAGAVCWDWVSWYRQKPHPQFSPAFWLSVMRMQSIWSWKPTVALPLLWVKPFKMDEWVASLPFHGSAVQSAFTPVGTQLAVAISVLLGQSPVKPSLP